MTDEKTRTQLERRAPELDRLARLGQWLAASETAANDPQARGASAALRFYYAEQLELPPTAVAELTVINGRLFMGAQLLRALAERAGYRVVRAEMTDTSATARLVVIATGEILGESTFTLEDAHRAGLIRDRSPWKTHPGRMCWARASTNVIRDFAPAVSLGIATNDEAVEIVGEVLDESYDEAEDIPFGEAETYEAEQELKSEEVAS